MRRLDREVGRGDQHGVGRVPAQRRYGDLQGAQTRKLLRGDREAGPSPAELRVDALIGQVGHAAERFRRLQRADADVAFSRAGGEFGKAQAKRVPGRVNVALGADDDVGPVGVAVSESFRRLGRRGEKAGMQRQGARQIGGRRAQAGQRERDCIEATILRVARILSASSSVLDAPAVRTARPTTAIGSRLKGRASDAGDGSSGA